MLRLLTMVTLFCALLVSLATPANGTECPPEFELSWGDSGSANGQFSRPWGSAVDFAGNVYIADRNNHRIQKFDADGNFLLAWGDSGSAAGQFDRPIGVAIDPDGDVWVTDLNNDRVQEFDTSGTWLRSVGSSGSGDGQFSEPRDIVFGNTGNFFVVESGNDRVQKFASDGTFLLKWGTFGGANGEFRNPMGIAWMPGPIVFVSDRDNDRIQEFDGAGLYIDQWGTFGTGDGQFDRPHGIDLDGGALIVADFGNDRMQKFQSDGTFLWGIPLPGLGPIGVCVGLPGQIYVSAFNANQVHRYGDPVWADCSTGPLANAGDNNGVALGDLDGDGDLDIYMTEWGANKYLRNDAGVFVDATQAPLGDIHTGQGVVLGDVDNDGDLDVYVVNYASGNKLFRNDGVGPDFADVSAASGTDDAGLGFAAAFADVDDDGDLDLYLVNDGANRLFRNDGGMTFADATAGPLGDSSSGKAGVFGDVDDDGDLDLYVVNDGAANKLLRNDGGTTFADVTTGPLGDTGFGQGAVFGDVDNDQDLDLYLVEQGANRLLRNDGGTFVDATGGAPLDDAGDGRGSAFGDVDNDGDQDLYLVNDNGMANKLFRNEGGGVFVDATAIALADSGNGKGVTLGDADGDGDLDIYVANVGGTNRFFQNVSAAEGNHWLHVNLEGVVSNRSAIGARVEAWSGGLSQIREVSGGSGYQSQNSLTVEFGLGAGTVVDSMSIRWPSGWVDRRSVLSVDGALPVSEPVSISTVGFASNPSSHVGVAVQADGKILLAGVDADASPTQAFVARFDGGGALDASFGTGGVVRTGFTSYASSGVGVAVQADGKILLAGVDLDAAPSQAFVARVDGGGVVDSSFGTGGVVRTGFASFPTSSEASVALQADGKILLVGVDDDASPTQAFVARFDGGGAPDASFGTCGVVRTGFASFSSSSVASVALQAYGKILLVGVDDDASPTQAFVARFDGGGAPDASFGTGGVSRTGFASHPSSHVGVAVQADGKILLAGVDADASPTQAFVARFDGGGAPDASFGTGGVSRTGFASDPFSGVGVAAQWDGKILLAGVDDDAIPDQSFVARFDGAGAPDASFGTGGVSRTGFASDPFSGVGVAVQWYGKILLAGVDDDAIPDQSFVARFDGGGALDASFGTGGVGRTGLLSVAGSSVSVAVQTGRVALAGVANWMSVDQAFVLTFDDPLAPPVGVGEPGALTPALFALHRSYPNPFRYATTIRFDLPRRTLTELRIYDVAGRLVQTLVNSEKDPGRYTLTWDGRNERGSRVASGVYFYRLEAGGRAETRKVVRLR